MAAHEPKCVQWKRQGAERLAEQLVGLSAEQELAFWQAQTTRLKFLQSEAKKHSGAPVKPVANQKL